MATVDDARRVLGGLKDAGSGRELLELGWIEQLRLEQNRAVFRLTLPKFAVSQRDRIASEARSALLTLEGIDDVQIELAQPGEGAPIGAAGHGQVQPQQPVPGVKQVIAVSSGKGGVGKSTVAVNLACALAASGLRVGLLDADIYGPNAPTMLGVVEQTPEVQGSGDEQRLTPISTSGLVMVSMGLLIGPDQPVIWRGPMLNGIIRQFLYQVEWGERDVLVVDLPPGTGDAQISLCQTVPLDGGVIVTTPQEASLGVVRKGIEMFKKVNVPILGIVENMSYFTAPGGERVEIFGYGGGQDEATRQGVPFLGEIPIFTEIRKGGDEGVPVVIGEPDSAPSQVFLQTADQLQEILSNQA